MKVLILAKRKINRHWLDILTASYLILTLTLGLYSLFHLGHPTSIMILLFEIIYLSVSLILTIVILAKINLFLIKLKRSNFKLLPLKIQLHSFNLWAIILWAILVMIYAFQSAWTIFGNETLLMTSFLEDDVFSYLITMQFSLTIYLLISMTAIFIYSLLLYKQKNIKIKIIPNNFWAFESAQFKKFTSFRVGTFSPLFVFSWYIEFYFPQLWTQMIFLSLKLKHLKTLALRQFKKETTPPSYRLFIN